MWRRHRVDLLNVVDECVTRIDSQIKDKRRETNEGQFFRNEKKRICCKSDDDNMNLLKQPFLTNARVRGGLFALLAKPLGKPNEHSGWLGTNTRIL